MTMESLLLKLFFCISAIYRVNGYELTLKIKSFEVNPDVPFTVETKMGDGNFDASQYTITFNDTVSEENDMPITLGYSYESNNGQDIEVDALFCKDRENVEGDAVSLTALTLGMSKEPSCPIASGTQFEQEQYFTIDTNDYPNIVFSPIGSGDDEYMTIAIGGLKILHLIAMSNGDNDNN